jgi:hypothetical protein
MPTATPVPLPSGFTMPINVRCSHCQLQQTFLDSFRGQEVRCRNCQQAFVAGFRPAAVPPQEDGKDAWSKERPQRSCAASKPSEPALAQSDGPTRTSARFSIVVNAPPRERGGHPDHDLPKAKHRRGLIYTPDPVDLEELREAEAAGDFSGLLVLGMGGAAALTLSLLVGLLMFAVFYRPAGRVAAGGGIDPTGQSPSAPANVQFPIFGKQPPGQQIPAGPPLDPPVFPDAQKRPNKQVPVIPLPEQPVIAGMQKQPKRAPMDPSRQNGVASFGFDGSSPRPWFEKTPAEENWEAQNKTLKVIYLAGLAEEVTAAAEHRFGKNGQVGNLRNDLIQVQGRSAPKGLGMCGPSLSYCAVRYVLPPGALYFKACAALNDSGAAGSGLPQYQFEVLLDGKTVAASRIMNTRGEYDSCTVAVNAAKSLELRSYSLGIATWQHSVWLEPRLYVRP